MRFAPAPLPSLAPGQSVTATSWRCTGTNSDSDGGLGSTSSTTADLCEVQSWAVLPAPSAMPNPLPVSFPTPLSVREVSPVKPATSTAGACSASTSTASADPCVVALHPQQFTAYGVAAALVLLLLAALFVAQLRRG